MSASIIDLLIFFCPCDHGLYKLNLPLFNINFIKHKKLLSSKQMETQALLGLTLAFLFFSGQHSHFLSLLMVFLFVSLALWMSSIYAHSLFCIDPFLFLVKYHCIKEVPIPKLPWINDNNLKRLFFAILVLFLPFWSWDLPEIVFFLNVPFLMEMWNCGLHEGRHS